jgi:2-C-methyl-D-erythritol 4-phosphate cytidylyltransferase
VAKALELVKDEAELIAVHDAVRCCLTNDWLDELFKTAGETGAAMLACPVVATLKKVEDGKIVDTVDRSNLYEAQTPQVFNAKWLKEGYAKLDKMDKTKITDDAQLAGPFGAYCRDGPLQYQDHPQAGCGHRRGDHQIPAQTQGKRPKRPL